MNTSRAISVIGWSIATIAVVGLFLPMRCSKPDDRLSDVVKRADSLATTATPDSSKRQALRDSIVYIVTKVPVHDAKARTYLFQADSLKKVADALGHTLPELEQKVAALDSSNTALRNVIAEKDSTIDILRRGLSVASHLDSISEARIRALDKSNNDLRRALATATRRRLRSGPCAGALVGAGASVGGNGTAAAGPSGTAGIGYCLTYN